MTGSETSSAGPVVSPGQALEFVASASALLAQSLDYETTLREVARLAVPDVADWCGVLLVDSGDGERELSSGYTERSRIAHTLQVKLLPERLPHIARTSTAARYRAAGELNEVGADFYDVFQRSANEWALVVGDVSGKGAEAAAVTALARYSLRAAALDEGRPAARCAGSTRDALRRHLAVRDRRHGLPLGRRRKRARRAPRARRSPGPRSAAVATAAWRCQATSARWPASGPTSTCTTSTCASRPATSYFSTVAVQAATARASAPLAR
jgi:hypothetical protein